VSDSVRYYEELQMGAEFLAGLSHDAAERTVHLKMAGEYWLKAQRAGGCRRPGLTH
jgi:hypothetical protein